MADESSAQQQQADISAVLSQHTHKVLESNMAEALQTMAVQTAVLAVHKATQLKDIAEAIKHSMDQKVDEGAKSEGVYHCVAGKSFASAISHGARQYMHLKVDTCHIILWKSK